MIRQKKMIGVTTFILVMLFSFPLVLPIAGTDSTGTFKIGNPIPTPQEFNSDEYLIAMLNSWAYAVFQYGMLVLLIVGVIIIILKVFYQK